MESFDIEPSAPPDAVRSRVSFRSSRNTTFEYSYETRTSVLSAALVTAGAASVPNELQSSQGGHLTIPQAIVVVFCSAFGAGISFVAWYPSLCGPVGFVLAALIVGCTAIAAEMCLLSTARMTEAKTFSEMCTVLPTWAQSMTEVASVACGVLLIGVYVNFCYDFANTTVFPLERGVVPTFLQSLARRVRLFSLVGLLVYVVTVPVSFSGTMAKVITNANLATTVAVIFVAVFKGLLEVSRHGVAVEFQSGFDWFNPAGFITVITLLSGAMFQIVIMPQINYELARSDQESAQTIIPCTIAGLQASVFVLVGLSGFMALGKGDDMNAFKRYSESEQMNDWMAMFLQSGIAFMMWLSCPLMMLPAKAQLWSMIGPKLGHSGELEDLNTLWKHGLNAVLMVLAISAPFFTGSDLFSILLVVGIGTLGNWINMFLPAMIIWKTRVIGASGAGRAKFKIIVIWILILAVGGVLNSCVQFKMGIDKLIKNIKDAAGQAGNNTATERSQMWELLSPQG